MAKHMVIALCLMGMAMSVVADGPFISVMYKNGSESSLGQFPISRSYYAQAIDLLAKSGARGVVLKFFFDLPGSDDASLARAMGAMPVFIQACINNGEKNPNALDARAYDGSKVVFRNVISGRSGWIPLPEIAKNAYTIGFVDIRDPNYIPLEEKYQGHLVDTLIYEILKFALPSLAILDGYLVNGKNRIRINDRGEVAVEYPKVDSLESYALEDLIQGKIDSSNIRGKIAIIGYDGYSIGFLKTPVGKIKSHRAFIYGLEYLYNELSKK